MSIPVDDVQLPDDMVYVLTLETETDAARFEQRQRILGEDYALLELADGTTTLVELMDDGGRAPITASAERMIVRYLIVG